MANNLKVFLNTSPTEALKLAPATIINHYFDESWPTETIRRYLAAAVRLSTMVNHRLDRLRASSRKAAIWNAPGSPEKYYFGDFSEAKLEKVCRTFQGISRHLSSARLEVTCNALNNRYGMAIPFIEKIWLGRLWRNPQLGDEHVNDAERVQTFIHEASHICGRFSTAEGKGYGRDAAHRLTQWRMRATRNADNYGYYALEVLDQACTY